MLLSAEAEVKNTTTTAVEDNGGAGYGGVALDPNAHPLTASVQAANDPPLGGNSRIRSSLLFTHTFDLSDFRYSDPKDSPPNDLHAVKVLSLPAVGNLRYDGRDVVLESLPLAVPLSDIVAGKFQFKSPGFWTPDTSFTFQLQDDGGTANGGSDLDPNLWSMDIVITDVVNFPPSGINHSISTLEDSTYPFAESDFPFTDGEADGLRAGRITSVPTSGKLQLSGAQVSPGQFVSAYDIRLGRLTYTPPADASGTSFEKLTFQIQDNGGTGTINGSDFRDLDLVPATLTIDVTPVNDPPVASGDSFLLFDCGASTSVAMPGVLQNDIDADKDKLTAVLVSADPNVGVDLRPDGSFVLTNALAGNTYSFSYRASDGQLLSNDVPVSVRVALAPILSPKATYSIVEDGTLSIPAADLVAIARTPCDSLGADNPTIVGLSLPAHGTATLNDNGGSPSVSYKPQADFNGNDSFTFTVGAGSTPSGWVTGTISIVVGPINDPPTFLKGSDPSATDENPATHGPPLPVVIPGWATKIAAGSATAIDETGQKLSFTLVLDNPELFLPTAQPAINATTGDLTFTPAPNAHGTAHLSVVLKDDGGTASGGMDTSPAQTFDIVITKPHIWHNTQRALTIDPMECPPNVASCVYPLGAVALVNYINAYGNTNGGHVPPLGSTIGGWTVGYGEPFGYIDINGDDFVAPNDLVAVINAINAGQAGAEGEPATASADEELWMLLAADVAASPKRRR